MRERARKLGESGPVAKSARRSPARINSEAGFLVKLNVEKRRKRRSKKGRSESGAKKAIPMTRRTRRWRTASETRKRRRNASKTKKIGTKIWIWTSTNTELCTELINRYYRLIDM